MPNMDGLKFLARIRALDEWKTVPIIMITTEGAKTR
jgi:DNA-binding response OmpR family regulator